MDDSPPMCHRQRLGGRADQAQAFAGGQAAAGESGGEVFAVEPGHGEVGFAVGHAAVGDVLHDAGVTQLGQDLGFVKKKRIVRGLEMSGCRILRATD